MIHSAEDVLLDRARRILVDANVLIAFLIKNTHSIQKFLPFKSVYLSGANFTMSNRACLSSKYWRRKMVTECLDLEFLRATTCFRLQEKL